MATESNFVLKWEIENPEKTLRDGQAISQSWSKGGFEWVVRIDRTIHRDPWTIFTVVCNENSGPWECDVEVSYTARKAGGTCRTPHRSTNKFTTNDNIWRMESGIKWSELSNTMLYNVNGKLTLEIRIKIANSIRADLTKFMSPIDTNNVTFLIGENKLVVSKEYLAMHSPVFAATFFGKFEENGKEEVELKEIVYDEFVQLLLVFFPNPVCVTDATVLSIAKLADRYQIQGVLDAAERHLLASNNFSIAKKFQLADDYRFNKLRDACLQSFKSIQELIMFKDSTLFDNYSVQLKAMICERMVQILREK